MRIVYFPLLMAIFAAHLLSACAHGREAHADDSRDEGLFKVLTYNVAGLPHFVSRSKPDRYMPIISQLLNRYELALVQEDFFYHSDLGSSARHPYRTTPISINLRLGLGDGLNLFSWSAFSNFDRQRWAACNGRFSAGSDCLTDKGFTRSEHRLAPGLTLHVYNVHLDAGIDAADDRARAAQVEQLLDALARYSTGRAVIVAGDFNIGAGSELLTQRMLGGASLTDACRSLACADPYRIDRIMFRSSSELELSALDFDVDESFVTREGKHLSDHEAIGAKFRWRAKRLAMAKAQ